MKNYLALVLALAVVSSPAFASRARLESLGEGKNGSYYIDDSRNIFLNPAQLVHYKKKLFLELGTDVQSIQDTASVNTAPGGSVLPGNRTNRPQGGFTNTFGDFTYGVYMNQNSERTTGIIQNANNVIANGAFAPLGITAANSTFLAPDSTLEAFFAGEGALNWGFSVFYGGNNNKPAAGFESTASQLGVRLGVDMNGLQLFSTVAIYSRATLIGTPVSNAEVKGKVGVDAALTYKMNDMTTFAKVTFTGADLNANNATQVEARNQAYGLGFGWKHEMTKATNMFARVEGDYEKARNNGNDQKTYNIPVVVGAEAQALTWLTIRGSIAESVFGQQYGNLSGAGFTRNNLGGSTTVSAGLGLTFGDVQIDGLVATNGANNTSNGIGAGFGTAPQTNTNFGFGDNMISRIALTYNF